MPSKGSISSLGFVAASRINLNLDGESITSNSHTDHEDGDRKRGDRPLEGIDDPTLRVQMEHEMRAIEELVFVTKLSFVPAHKDKAQGFRATLSCALCRWYDSCGKG